MTTETSTQQPQSWWRAAPLPEMGEGEAFSHDAMVGHFAAMYVAHIEAYCAAMWAQHGKLPNAEQRAAMTPEELDAVGVPLRAAIVEHLYPARSAWATTALLMGKTPEDVWGCSEDPQVMDELGREWLIKATGMTGEQIRALTTTPIKGEDGLY